jgi:hypothetical protein
MPDIYDNINCSPQGEYVTKERAEKFSEKFESDENVHYILPVASFELDGDKKRMNGRTHLALFSQKRILILIKSLLGKNEIREFGYEQYDNSYKKSARTKNLSTLVLKGGGLFDNIKILTNMMADDEISDTVQFINNVIEDVRLNKKISSKGSKKELKRTCKSCGNVWHVEKEEIQDLKEKKKENEKKSNIQGLAGAVAAGNMSEKNKQDAIQRLKELNKCPECRSSNYKEEKVRPGDLEETSKVNNSDEDVTEDNQDDENTSEVNYCPQCGEEINEDEASFCKNCGTSLD